jgi:hypothetical protein
MIHERAAVFMIDVSVPYLQAIPESQTPPSVHGPGFVVLSPCSKPEGRWDIPRARGGSSSSAISVPTSKPIPYPV